MSPCKAHLVGFPQQARNRQLDSCGGLPRNEKQAEKRGVWWDLALVQGLHEVAAVCLMTLGEDTAYHVLELILLHHLHDSR
jgi:hypothetical protein